jgi:hypothetical protein
MFSSGADSFSPANRLHPHYQRANPSVSRAGLFASVVYNNHHSFTYAASVAERNGLKPYGSDPASGVPPAPDHGLKPRGLRRVQTVKSLRERGLRVSIDSFDPAEVSLAVAAGAELVLSVNATNRDHAVDWGVEVVAIPDQPGSLEGLDQTVSFLGSRGIPFRTV